MQTQAKIIADTINSYGARITTFEVVAPRFLLAEVNTHRVIAKSAASSRAIPVEKRIAMANDAPFVPAAFGKNQPGMQAEQTLDEENNAKARQIWLQAAKAAAGYAGKMAQLGVHKQHANRLLEPFVYYTGVMTSTEWQNFWTLRTHKDAQPEFRELALQMLDVYKASQPRKYTHHLPYTDDCPDDMDLYDKFAVSSARCARVSYKTFDGKVSSLDKDLQLCEDLIASGHLSPFDHAAVSDNVRWSGEKQAYFWMNPVSHRHNWGWIPYRVEVENQKGWNCARNSFAPISDYTEIKV